MNNPEFNLLLKEKMQKYVPDRPIQVMHCGAIIMASIAIGALSIPPEGGSPVINLGTLQQLFGAWFGFYIALAGLTGYYAWTNFRVGKARKEAQEEYLAASPNNKK